MKIKNQMKCWGPIPYAVIRFNGELVHMNATQFYQAVRDAKVCRCGKCFSCCVLREFSKNEEVQK